MLTSSNPIAFNSYERSIEQAVYILVYSRYQLRAENLDSRFLWKILEERERIRRGKKLWNFYSKYVCCSCLILIFMKRFQVNAVLSAVAVYRIRAAQNFQYFPFFYNKIDGWILIAKLIIKVIYINVSIVNFLSITRHILSDFLHILDTSISYILCSYHFAKRSKFLSSNRRPTTLTATILME